MDKVEEFWTGRILVRWYATRWCNYKCSYCRQEHERKQTYRGSPGHWADNRSVDEWLAAFKRHFGGSKLTLVLTGGEPMLDAKNTVPFLERLLAEDYVSVVPVTTNLSWNLGVWDSVKHPKLELFASYHPEHVELEDFLAKVEATKAAGWNVLYVALVTADGRFADRVGRYLNSFDVDLAVIPPDGSLCGGESADSVRRYIPSLDWAIRTGDIPYGRDCLHPSLAYKVHPNGDLAVGCHPHLAGNLFDDALPQRPTGYVPCPKVSCVCEEKYSFLRELGVNVGDSPHRLYGLRLKEQRRG